MIHRYILLKIKDEFSTAEWLQSIAEESLNQLSRVPQVVDIRIGKGVAGTSAEWDMVLTVTLRDLAEIEAYRVDPIHRDYYENFLYPKLDIIKAVNFEIIR